MTLVFKMHKPVRSRHAVAPLHARAPRPVTRTESDLARPREIGGPEGPEPTRYGDWERKGICYDF